MVEYSGKTGRPRFQIYSDQLRFLLILNFPVTDIATFFAVNVRTVHRRMSGCLLSVSSSYSTVTGQELDAILRDILIDFPNTGYRRILGHLNARGMRVQEKPVRRSFHRVDLEDVIKRCISLRTIQRRKYNVKGSNSLWHIDGIHKVIRLVAICHLVFYTEKQSERKQSQFWIVLNECDRIWV